MTLSDRHAMSTNVMPADFPKYKRYTTTYIAAVNWKIDHIALYQYLNIIKLANDPLIGVKRAQVRLNVPNGSILQVKYKDAYKIVHVRGYGTEDNASTGCFSNSTTVVMYVGKIIVLKVPSQGKIQITGCRTEDQVYQAIHSIWKGIQKIKVEHPEVAQIPEGEVPRVIYHSVMNNINMNLGFSINKRKVHEFLYQDTDFHIIPNDKKYAGVTAKLEVEGMQELPLMKHRFLEGKWYASKGSWTDYLSMLSPKDRKKEENTDRYQTFLIFHSGKVIQSGPRYELMGDVFHYFVSLMNSSRSKIEDLTIELSTKKRQPRP
jgi:TATA-box binding protein (TBP) (component of TFIID and TFIIIB)